jgi:glycosidase
MLKHFFILLTLPLFAQIQRVEPPFWWTDMNRSQIEIMFYHPNISGFEVKTSNGLPFQLKKTENPNYLFITVETKSLKSQTFDFVFTKGKEKLTYKYELKARKPESKSRLGFSSADVIYLLMPDRFANGNPNNDSQTTVTEQVNRALPGGRHGGDIAGIIKNLDYLNELGATAIWSTPLCEDNDKAYSYHGYGQSDVYKIDPRYGTNEEYLKLSAELKKRGMKLIKDYVTNHWGEQHWMIKDLPTYDWINQFPGFKQTNYRMTTHFDTNAAESDRKLCADGWFVKSMPDLNQNNPMVQNYLIQNAIWWIEYADLDGLRVDTYSYCDKDKIAEWTKAIMDEYPNFNIVAEVWFQEQAHIAYWQKDSQVGAIQNYNSHCPSVMDFTLFNFFDRGGLNEIKAEWSKGLIKLYENFVNDFLYPNVNNVLVFLENHDTMRFNERYPNFNDYQMGLSVIATTRGIPQIYYGSEIGMQGNKDKGGDADIRRDFPGGWANDANNAFSEMGRTAQQKQYFDFTKKILNWRKNKIVIHSGQLKHFVPENNVYVYFRYNEKETVMVVINNNLEEQTIDLNRFSNVLKGSKSAKDVLTDEVFPLDKLLTIKGKSVLVLEVY